MSVEINDNTINFINEISSQIENSFEETFNSKKIIPKYNDEFEIKYSSAKLKEIKKMCFIYFLKINNIDNSNVDDVNYFKDEFNTLFDNYDLNEIKRYCYDSWCDENNIENNILLEELNVQSDLIDILKNIPLNGRY
jgi:hypothetical protein